MWGRISRERVEGGHMRQRQCERWKKSNKPNDIYVKFVGIVIRFNMQTKEKKLVDLTTVMLESNVIFALIWLYFDFNSFISFYSLNCEALCD